MGQLGELLGAPHFAQDPCLNLQRYPLREWNGLLFEDNGRDIAADLAHMGPASTLSFEGMVLDHVELHTCHYNWKTFIEVYLEDYHVAPFHPGLGNFVTCDDLRGSSSPSTRCRRWACQNLLGKAAARPTRSWHEVLMQYRNGELPEQGAVWLTYYPHIMVEWYPHVLTGLDPAPDQRGQDAEHGGVLLPRRDRRLRARVHGGAARRLHGNLHRGRRDRRAHGRRPQGPVARGDNEVGPYQSPMEDGMQHFHEWYRRQMGEHLRGKPSLQPWPPRQRPLQASLWMLLASLFFATMGVCIKFASDHFNSFEIVAYRGLVGVVFLLGLTRVLAACRCAPGAHDARLAQRGGRHHFAGHRLVLRHRQCCRWPPP
jgi:choline monooxygenase